MAVTALLPQDDVGHTPGPWIVNPFRAQVDCQTLSEKGGLLPVARMLWPTDERSEAETEANAQLIAAAPDLLDALSRAIKWLAVSDDPRSTKDLNAAEAAVRKARRHW
jgi:hypothetical protein